MKQHHQIQEIQCFFGKLADIHIRAHAAVAIGGSWNVWCCSARPSVFAMRA